MIFYRKIQSTQPPGVNTELESGFLQNYQRDDVKKTHQFEGRYENIYLTQAHIPALQAVIHEATRQAEKLTGKTGLRAGYWFNYMPPGAVTVNHRHDDDDEVLSGVYYITVPTHSGNLILHNKIHHGDSGCEPDDIEIIPQAGTFVFFKPDIAHEVTQNLSNKNRLSIGMNFGIPHNDE